MTMDLIEKLERGLDSEKKQMVSRGADCKFIFIDIYV